MEAQAQVSGCTCFLPALPASSPSRCPSSARRASTSWAVRWLLYAWEYADLPSLAGGSAPSLPSLILHATPSKGLPSPSLSWKPALSHAPCQHKWRVIISNWPSSFTNFKTSLEQGRREKELKARSQSGASGTAPPSIPWLCRLISTIIPAVHAEASSAKWTHQRACGDGKHSGFYSSGLLREHYWPTVASECNYWKELRGSPSSASSWRATPLKLTQATSVALREMAPHRRSWANLGSKPVPTPGLLGDLRQDLDHSEPWLPLE